MELFEIKNIQKESLRLHSINNLLDPNLPEENYLLQINIKKLKQLENQLDNFIVAAEKPRLSLVQA